MMSTTNSELFDFVRTTILSTDPRVDVLQERIATELGFDAEDTRTLIYDVVAKLNASSFPPITQLELVHTEGCNLACSYCFEKDMLGRKRMSPEVARRAIDLLFDYSRGEKDLRITHFGGEPTLNFSGIRDATEYAERKAAACQKSVAFDMTTNGVLLDDDMINYLSEHRIRILLSVDGLEASHDRYRLDKKGRGTFSRVLAAMSAIKKKQPWIGVKMTVMPQNVDDLFEDVVGLHKLGANQFIIGHASGVEWPPLRLLAYEKQMRALLSWYRDQQGNSVRIDELENIDETGGEQDAYFGCQAGRTAIAVTIAGEISPCSKIMGLGTKQLVGKLGDIYYGLTHLRNRSELINCGRLISACQDKGIAEDYRGGCFAVNYGENGDMFKPSDVEHAFTLLKRSVCAGCSKCGH